LLLEDGSLRLATDPVTANWNSAQARARQEMKVDLHVWAVDQPLLVTNEPGINAIWHWQEVFGR
jgi:hypothetical protein